MKPRKKCEDQWEGRMRMRMGTTGLCSTIRRLKRNWCTLRKIRMVKPDGHNWSIEQSGRDREVCVFSKVLLISLTQAHFTFKTQFLVISIDSELNVHLQ